MTDKTPTDTPLGGMQSGAPSQTRLTMSPSDAERIVIDRIAAFEIERNESPGRIRVGRAIYRAVVDASNIGAGLLFGLKVGGSRVLLDLQLRDNEALADAFQN